MALPKPHQRPSIDLSDNRPKSWQDLPAFKLTPGDIVLDRGKVIQVTADDLELAVLVTFLSQVSTVYGIREIVRAFGYTR
jgi:hypothetical protein